MDKRGGRVIEGVMRFASLTVSAAILAGAGMTASASLAAPADGVVPVTEGAPGTVAPAKVKVRGLKRFEDESEEEFEANPKRLMETTAGRVIFNSSFPDDFPFQNDLVKKKELAALVDRCAHTYNKADLANILDALGDTARSSALAARALAILEARPGIDYRWTTPIGDDRVVPGAYTLHVESQATYEAYAQPFAIFVVP